MPASDASWTMLNEVMPSGPHAAQFAVEIGLAGAERRHRRGDRRIFGGPVEPGARQQLHRAAVEAGMHAVAVIFDFVQPLIAFRRGVDELGELRPDPLRKLAAFPDGGLRHGSDRLRSAAIGSMRRRIVVLDVADARAHRPADHVIGRVGGQQRLELRQLGRLFAKPHRPGLRCEHHRHAVVQLGA